eukprot:gene13807-13923_t
MSVFKALSLSTCAPNSRRSFLVLAFGLTLSGCMGYDGAVERGYMPDAETLAQVQPGMAADKVLTLLGTPSTTSTIGGDAWYYISQKVERKLEFMRPQVTDQRVLAVYFGKGKKVERIANYGLEDGKVFDFITRTTPTGGSEPSFIRNMFKGLLRFS